MADLSIGYGSIQYFCLQFSEVDKLTLTALCSPCAPAAAAAGAVGGGMLT
jgi:hypothetical protein